MHHLHSGQRLVGALATHGQVAPIYLRLQRVMQNFSLTQRMQFPGLCKLWERLAGLLDPRLALAKRRLLIKEQKLLLRRTIGRGKVQNTPETECRKLYLLYYSLKLRN